MTVPLRQRGQVLILLATWLIFGGGASSALVVYQRSASEMKSAVKSVLPDSVRRDATLSDVSHWESGQEKADEAVSTGREKLLNTLRRKDAQRSEVEPILATLDQEFAEMDRNFLDLRFRVKTQVTSAEWAAIVGRTDH